MDISKIKSGMLVRVKAEANLRGLGIQPVGTVDHLDGNGYIKLTRRGSPEGKHRWVPLVWVERVDEEQVYLNCTLVEFQTYVRHVPPTEHDSGREVGTIGKDELWDMIRRGEPPQLVNVLDPKYYYLGSIKGSLKIPFAKLEERLSELDSSREVITYCSGYECHASREAARKLTTLGFTARAYEGGINEWRKAHYPTQPNRQVA